MTNGKSREYAHGLCETCLHRNRGGNAAHTQAYGDCRLFEQDQRTRSFRDCHTRWVNVGYDPDRGGALRDGPCPHRVPVQHNPPRRFDLI